MHPKRRGPALHRSAVALVALALGMPLTLTVGAQASDLDATVSAAKPVVVARVLAGETSWVDARGRSWQADEDLALGGVLKTLKAPPRGAKSLGLYKNMRVRGDGWRIPVSTSGRYRIRYRVVNCAAKASCRRSAAHRIVTTADDSLRIPDPVVRRAVGVAAFVVRLLPESPDGRTRPLAVTAPVGGVFGPRSVWRLDVRSAPVAEGSSAMVANLVEQIRSRYNGVAAFNLYRYGLSWYTVPADQPRARVLFSNCQNKPRVPDGVYGPGGQFEGVPIPDDAIPTPGTDSTLTIYQPATDTLWEFWKAYRDNAGWHACWGGRIDDVSTSAGHFSGYFGASATGLPYGGGAVTIADARAGRIDHALSLNVPVTAHYSNFSWPAQRSDGDSWASDALPEGIRLRLDPGLDLDSLKLSPVGRMVAEAAQRYGFIITDRSGAVALAGENPALVAAKTGGDPWIKILDGTPTYEVFRNFPWEQLQVLPKNYGRSLVSSQRRRAQVLVRVAERKLATR